MEWKKHCSYNGHFYQNNSQPVQGKIRDGKDNSQFFSYPFNLGDRQRPSVKTAVGFGILKNYWGSRNESRFHFDLHRKQGWNTLSTFQWLNLLSEFIIISLNKIYIFKLFSEIFRKRNHRAIYLKLSLFFSHSSLSLC